MVLPTNLDMDVLRTFVTGMDLGSFAKAAARLGRSPSAISLQLRKLETQVGSPLVAKLGRGLALTEAGEMMLGYARRLLDLNDAALQAIRMPAVSGLVRLGMPQDLAETWLPDVLARFARIHPGIRIEPHIDRNAMLSHALEAGTLDLALIWRERTGRRDTTTIAEVPVVWIGPRSGFVRDPEHPIPLVAFAPPCLFREMVTSALDAAHMPWRVAFSSPGLTGVWAAVVAGLGISARTTHGIPPTLRALDATTSGLPPLPRLSLSLRFSTGPPSKAADCLASLLRDVLAPGLL